MIGEPVMATGFGELKVFSLTFSPGVCSTATVSCVISDQDAYWTTAQAGLSRLKVYDSVEAATSGKTGWAGTTPEERR